MGKKYTSGGELYTAMMDLLSVGEDEFGPTLMPLSVYLNGGSNITCEVCLDWGSVGIL